MNIYLSKSKYCTAVQCNKILWLNENKPEEKIETDNEKIIDNCQEIGEFARNLFGDHITIPFDNNLKEMIINTQKYMSQKTPIICEASFEYDNNFCSVDILRNLDDGIEIYEVKGSTEMKNIYINDLTYQLYILTNLGYNIKKAAIVHINSNYVRNGDIEIDNLFTIEEQTDLINNDDLKNVANKIEELRKYMLQNEEPFQDISYNCFSPYKCDYWNYCSKHLPIKNVFCVKGMRKTKQFELYQKGIYTYEDLLTQKKLNKKYIQQIEFDLYNKEPEIDIIGLQDFISNLYYPLYFLDFETFQQPIPKYDGISPYQQIPFQYSLHYIEYEGGPLLHREFLAEAGKDPRRNLAEQLIADIPANTCILTYNMKFEKMVLNGLAKIFDDLSDDLLELHKNIQDLMIPFSKRMYYQKEMAGSFSIKKVLPTLFPNSTELNYKTLPCIHNGSEAMNSFATLNQKNEEEQKIIRYGLLEYCKLDTLAMVKIWEKLKDFSSHL